MGLVGKQGNPKPQLKRYPDKTAAARISVKYTKGHTPGFSRTLRSV